MKSAALVSILILLSAPVWAQDKMDSYREVVEVLEDVMLPRLIDRLPAKEQEVLRDIDIVFEPNPVVVTTVVTEKNSKKIYIFAGFLDGLFNFTDCLLLIPNSKGQKICGNYFDYYFDHIVIRKNKQAPPSFVEVMLVDDQKISRWYKNEKLHKARKAMILSALTVIVMHEMGHHIVGFTAPGMSVSERRKLEARVDRWAIDRLTRMQENPVVGASIALGYLSQMERFRKKHGVNSFALHPMPKARVQYAFDKGCGGAANGKKQTACNLLKDLISTYE